MGIFPGKCKSDERLDGKVIIITGCNTGIGKCTAEDLFKRGGKVIMACRDISKAEEAKNDILKKSLNCSNLGTLIVKKLDLSSIESIKKFANEILDQEKEIHILINNAGVAFISPKSLTEDGFELQFGTNYLGHFLLTILLLPKLIESGFTRIINLSSVAHLFGDINFDDLNSEKSYGPIRAYGRSKLAIILFTKELARRLEGKNVNVYAVHPGIVRTDLDRHADSFVFPGSYFIYHYFLSWIWKTPEDGAQTTIYCAVDEKVKSETGLYYCDCKVANPAAKAKDLTIAKKLWDVSWEYVKLKKDYDPFR